jgi:hypothetical protein
MPVLRRALEPHRRPRDPALQGRQLASCAPCNRRKGDRLPHQVDMHPRVKPRIPSAHIFIQLASPTIPATWKQYLLHEAA